MNLVIVEDSELIRTQLLRMMSAQLGISVLGIASDEESAVSLIGSASPDVVLLDLALSPGSGVRVLERIRAAGCNSRVLVLTNNTGDAMRAACEAFGISGFYDKSQEVPACMAQLCSWQSELQVNEAPPVIDQTAPEPNDRILIDGILDSVETPIVLLDRNGIILRINRAWREFATENNAPPMLCQSVGIDYFMACRKAAACGDLLASSALAGLHDVLDGKKDVFSLEYSCHSAEKKRWFNMTVRSLASNSCQLVVTHINITAQRLLLNAAEEKMKQEHTLLEAIDSVGHGIWDWNPRTEHVDFSPQWKAMLGYAEHEIGNSLDEWQKRVHPDDLPGALMDIQRHLNGEVPTYRNEHRLLGKDGHWRWVLDQGMIIERDYEGRPQRIVGTHTDVTWNHEASDQLIKLTQAVEQYPHAIMFTDLEGNLVYVNKAFQETTGYSSSEVIGKNPRLLQSGQTPPNTYVSLWSALKAGSVWQGELINRRKNGEIYVEFSHLAPVREVNGTITHYLAITENITEKKRLDAELNLYRHHLEGLVSERTAALAAANETLTRHAQKIADLYDRAPCGYHSLDPDGRIIGVNETELKMLGFDLQEYLGRPIAEFMTPESARLFHQHFDEFRRSGRARDLEYDFVRKDGGILPVLISADMVRDDAGAFVSNHATMVDNSERMERQRQIAEMQSALAARTEEAEAATKAKSAFLASMSHEIRTPMNAIIGLTHLAERNATSPQQREHLRKAGVAAQHLLQVINDILDLSKIEAGKLTLVTAPFELAEVFDNTLTMIRDKAEAKGLQIGSEIDQSLSGVLVGDSLRIGQLLINFATNAIKFTEHGCIFIRAHLQDEAADGLTLRCTVTDSGIGIEPTVLEGLFQPFVQANHLTAHQFGGTGLGLAISRRLAELMGGNVGAESIPGQGSSFWFTVRVMRARPGQADSKAVSATDAYAPENLENKVLNARLLLVDDEPINREIALELLSDKWRNVDVAEDGLKAVELAKQNSYNLILMDMQMPGLDGLSATRQIRQLSTGKDVPIVAMTANAFDEDRRSCVEAGMNDFLSKPVDPDVLFSTVIRWLSLQRKSV